MKIASHIVIINACMEAVADPEFLEGNFDILLRMMRA